MFFFSASLSSHVPDTQHGSVHSFWPFQAASALHFLRARQTIPRRRRGSAGTPRFSASLITLLATPFNKSTPIVFVEMTTSICISSADRCSAGCRVYQRTKKRKKERKKESSSGVSLQGCNKAAQRPWVKFLWWLKHCPFIVVKATYCTSKYINIIWFSWKELSNSRPFMTSWDKNETKKQIS